MNEDAGFDKGLKAGIEQGKKDNAISIAKYNIPIDVDTIEKGYPILCA